MGSTAAFNIMVEVGEPESEALARLVADEFSEFEQTDERSYSYEVPDSIDSGQMLSSNDSIHMVVLNTGNEYYGVSEGERLLIHYSPYYSEEMETLRAKLEFLDSVEDFLRENVETVAPDAEVRYVVSACTI